MFLLSRIIGVSIYAFFLITFCLLLNRQKNSNYCKKVLIIYLIILGVMAFFFVPNKGNDLYRTYWLMNIYSTEKFNVFMERLSTSSSPVSLLYFRYIGKLNINNLLPFITALICYGNIYFILYDFYKKNNISNKSLSMTLLSTMCTSSYMFCISNIRTMLAFSILAKCIYDEMFNNKSIIKNILKYLIASLIHNTAIVIVFLRFVCYFFVKGGESNKLRSVLSKVLIVILFIAILFFGRNIIFSVADKANSYITESSYNYIWENVIGWFYLLFLIYVMFSSSLKSFYKEHADYKKIISILILIILAFCFEHSIFMRFILFAQIIFIPTILKYFDNMVKSEKISKYKDLNLHLLLLLFILVISCFRGNLCSLKFWD